MSDRSKAISLVDNLIESCSCYEGLKELCQQWKAAVGTSEEKALSDKLFTALNEDISSIDSSIEFFESGEAAGIIGAETVAQLLPEFKSAKDKGAKYCLCDACTAGLQILENKDLFA